jgi:16S rRNA (uracil1498-N3)-methyltransferase
VAVAPTKHSDRIEWLVEKLVEIGVDRITPLRCMRSERRDINAERLRKIAVAAMKQSLKALLPRVDEMTPLTAYLAEAAASGEQRFVGYCDADTERRLLARAYSPGAPVRLLIGPEGDFAPEEIAAALRAGYAPVTMGDNRLRTETAALTACDTIHIVNQLML